MKEISLLLMTRAILKHDMNCTKLTVENTNIDISLSFAQ
jgi:hypothetical protein